MIFIAFLDIDGNEYDTWNDLVPDAFSVPREEFEVYWQAYLAEKYQ